MVPEALPWHTISSKRSMTRGHFLFSGLFVCLLCTVITGFHALGVPITMVDLAGSNLAGVGDSYDWDNYAFPDLQPVPLQDHGGASYGSGDPPEQLAYAYCEESLKVDEMGVDFQCLLHAAVLSDSVKDPAWAHVSLWLTLYIGEPCAYRLLDESGGLTGCGVVSPGPWNLNLGGDLQVVGVGEEQQNRYFYLRLAPYTAPDGGSTGLLAGMSLIGLAFARRLTRGSS